MFLQRQQDKICRPTARARLVAAIRLDTVVKNEHFGSFWYSTQSISLIANFTVLLYATAKIPQEARYYATLTRIHAGCIKSRIQKIIL